MTLQKTPSGWSHEAANRQRPVAQSLPVAGGVSSGAERSWLVTSRCSRMRRTGAGFVVTAGAPFA